LVVDALAPWMPDAHILGGDCQVIHLGPDPLYSRFPVRNFRSNVSITSETGAGLVALAGDLAVLADDGHHPDRSERRSEIDAFNTERRAALLTQTRVGTGPMTKPYVARCVGDAI